MLQNLTKPPEGETAGESIQIALAASAPNGNNTLISPLHTPEGSRHGSDEPAAAGSVAGAAAMPAPAAVEPDDDVGVTVLILRREREPLIEPTPRSYGPERFAIVSIGIGDRVLFHPAPREPRHELANVYKL